MLFYAGNIYLKQDISSKSRQSGFSQELIMFIALEAYDYDIMSQCEMWLRIIAVFRRRLGNCSVVDKITSAFVLSHYFI